MHLPERWLSDSCVRAALGDPPKQQAISVLRNDTIDRWFARAHPAVPAIVFTPIIVGAVLYASVAQRMAPLAIAGCVLAGIVTFSLLEYLLHRFIFHYEFGEGRADRITAFLTHGYHHIYPDDPGRLVLPPMLSLPIGVVLAAGYAACLPLGAAAGVFAGTAAGYVAYDSMHWWLHHGKAKTQLGRWLKRYHILHHYDHHVARFGVSTPLWDFVFGTYAPTGANARKSRMEGAEHPNHP